MATEKVTENQTPVVVEPSNQAEVSSAPPIVISGSPPDLDDVLRAVREFAEEDDDDTPADVTQKDVYVREGGGGSGFMKVSYSKTKWATSDNRFWKSVETTESLPPGAYRCGISNELGPILSLAKLSTDNLLTLPEIPVQEVLQEIVDFQAKREEFKKRKMLFKRGIFLWGPPGSGKTSAIHMLLDLVVNKHGGIALLVENPGNAGACLSMIRAREPDRQILCILEDLDALVQHYDESSFLSLLDGESQVDNIVFVATTNYPEKLDKRFKDRPSRFDLIKYVGMPSDQSRESYLRQSEPGLSNDEVKAYVTGSKGYSMAHLKELLILTKVFGKSLKEATERINTMRSQADDVSSDKDPSRAKLGFFNS